MTHWPQAVPSLLLVPLFRGEGLNRMLSALSLLRVRVHGLAGRKGKLAKRASWMLGRWPQEVSGSLCRMLELVWSLFNTEQNLEQATVSSKTVSLHSVPSSPSPLLAHRGM